MRDIDADDNLKSPLTEKYLFEIGEHARITRHSDSRDELSIEILKRLGVGRRLNKHEATILLGEWEFYRRQLTQSSIRMSQRLSAEIVAIDGEYQLWIVERFVSGRSTREMLEGSGLSVAVSILNHALALVETIDDSGRHHSSGYLTSTVAIDFKPSNFVIEDNALTLVDTFPPLRIDNERISDASYNPKLHRFSYDKLTYVTGTRIGMMSRFTQLLLSNISLLTLNSLRASMEHALISEGSKDEPPHCSFRRDFFQEMQHGFPTLKRYY